MLMGLAAFAGFLMLVYFVYFINVIKGAPQVFEMQLLKTLAQWMISRGPSSRRLIWFYYLLTLVMEFAYFAMVFYLLDNPVIRVFSMFMVSFEILHVLLVGYNLSRFFGGHIPLKNLLRWPVERASAMLFFTHTFLVLINIIFYQV